MALSVLKFLLGLTALDSGGPPPAPPEVGPGFDPAISSANFTFTDDNRTVTQTVSTNSSAYADTPLTSGKKYFEILANNVSAATRFGLAKDTVTTAALIGSTTDTVGVFGSGSVRANNIDTGVTIGAVTAADRVCIAVDFDARLVWARRNGGLWNGNASADPATGAAGVDFSAIAGTMRPGFSGNALGLSGTIALGGLSIAFAVPSGYTVVVGGNP